MSTSLSTARSAAVPVPLNALREGYRARNVGKAFSGVTVLADVSLDFRPGEVHTLMGENGAGKSTLLKILSGIYRADSGQFSMDGESVTLGSPRAALDQGVYLVPQEPSLLPHLSVAENLYLGNSPKHGPGRLRWLDWGKMYRSAEDVLPLVGLSVDASSPVSRLTIAQQQLLECARALVRNSRVIFFDEPTSPLTSHEVETLFGVIDGLRAQGYVLGFISHRMDEVLEISDRISVLRDGHFIDSVARADAVAADLVNKMVGRSLVLGKRKATCHTTEETVVEVSGLNGPSFSDVSFHVNRGEVVGFAGLVGSGRTEIAEAMVNLRPHTAGSVKVGGTDLASKSLREVIDAGLVYLPEDRARNGAFLDMTVTENVSAGMLNRLRAALGLLDLRREQREAAAMTSRLKVRAASLDLPIRSLSGGNQQRCLFGKWLLTSPKAAVFDEPTRGVDAGAKEDLYQVIDELAADGLAVVVISSELEELVRLCDRVLAVYEGRIVGELSGDEISMENVGRLILGSHEPTP